MIAFVMVIVGGRWYFGVCGDVTMSVSGCYPSLGCWWVGGEVWVVVLVLVCHSSMDCIGDDIIWAISRMVLSISSSVRIFSNSCG